jgi:hypothetical protein
VIGFYSLSEKVKSPGSAEIEVNLRHVKSGRQRMTETPVVFCDTVQSVGVHNGLVRIAFIRLDANGRPEPALELMIPVAQVASLMRALQGVARG